MAGLFGNRPMQRNPFAGTQEYQTPGYGDSTRPGYGQPPMGTPGIDPSLMQIGPDAYAGQRPEATPGFFGKGRKLRDFVGYGLGAIAQQFGGQNPYQQQMDADNETQREIVKAKLLAQLKGDQTQEPSSIRTLRALGIDPQSPEGRRIGVDSLTRPFMVGSPESGYNPVGGSYGAPQSGPPPEAIADLQADPSGAAEFDQIFGAGASRRYLGQ
jgi:hypothetical protein